MYCALPELRRNFILSLSSCAQVDSVAHIIGANIVKDFFAGIRDVVGGRSASYEQVLREAKDTSMNEMMERARAIGANAIVGIDIDYETIGSSGSMLMVATSGTAVVL